MKETITTNKPSFFATCKLLVTNCKFKNFLLLIVNCLLASTHAQTTIAAGNVSGTWTKAASPYKIQGEIIVAKGSTLILEPGAVLEFQGLYGIKVDGILKAEGKKGDSIIFKAADSYRTWGGIHYRNNTQTDTIRFNYCHFENVSYGFRFNFINYAIACLYSSPIKIKNTAFYYNNRYSDQSGYIYVRKTIAIIDSIFINGSADTIRTNYISGILIDSVAEFSISNIKLKNFKIFLTLIAIYNSNGNILNKPIINNIFVTNSYKTDALFLYYSQDLIINNLDFNKTRKSIFINSAKRCKINKLKVNNALQALYSFGDCTGSSIENSTFDGCGTANTNFDFASLDIQSSGPLFKNCKFINNKRGITVYQKYGAGTPIFLNCLFSNTKAGSAVSINGYPVFINCNFQNNTDLKYYGHFLNYPYGGGISVVTEIDNSRPYFYNCLIWGNKDSFGHHNNVVLYGNVVKADFTNCIVQGDSTTGIVGFDDDKDFVKIPIPKGNLTYANSSGKNPSFIDSAAGNYQLLNTCSKTSYGINKGTPGNLLSQYPFSYLNSIYGVNIYNTTDLAGNPRVADDTLDIGCYESTGTKKSLKLLSSYNDTTLCYGGTKTCTAKTAGTVQTYQWQQKQGNTITNLATTPSIALANLKTTGLQYRLVVINNECLPLKDSSAWFTINLNHPLAKGIAKNPNKDTIMLNQTMQLSTVANGYNNLLWSTGETLPSISFTGSSLGAIGKYRISIEAKNNNGCTETDTVFINTKANSTGVFNLSKNNNIKLYPQPASNILTIELTVSTMLNNALIQIHTLEGKLLYTQTPLNSLTEIPLHNITKGIYLLTIKTNKETSVLKWMKE